MSDGENLLEAICQQPEEILPRLAYADWLEEHGESPRAGFIRLQIQRAALDPVDPAYSKLLTRERALLRAHGKQWTDTGLDMVGELHRGFIEHVNISPPIFLKHGAALFARFPIRRLTVRFDDDELAPMREMATSPLLRNIRVLRFTRSLLGSETGQRSIRQLLGSPHLQALQELHLRGCGLTDSDTPALTRFPNLRLLELTYNRIGASGMEDLASAANLAGLRHLQLDNTRIGAAGAEALADSPHLRQLSILDLSHSRILSGGIRFLCASSVLASVRILRLNWLNLRIQAANQLARCAHLRNLQELQLKRNRLEDDGVAVLAASPHLTGLRVLALARNGLTIAGARKVGESASLKGVQVLDFKGNEISKEQREELRQQFGKRWGRF